MKKAFEVLRDRPKLHVRLTRDSVCAGDDCDAPHEKSVFVHSFMDPTALVSHLASGYLPTVNGLGHTWDCMLNAQLIATISLNDISPKVAEVTYAEANHVHFIYNSATYSAMSTQRHPDIRTNCDSNLGHRVNEALFVEIA